MLFQYLYTQTGLNRFHSVDLEDMRRALLDDDQDGSIVGTSDVRAAARKTPQRHRPAPFRKTRRRTGV